MPCLPVEIEGEGRAGVWRHPTLTTSGPREREMEKWPLTGNEEDNSVGLIELQNGQWLKSEPFRQLRTAGELLIERIHRPVA